MILIPRQMELENIYDFYLKLKDDTLAFLYQGEFSDEITDKIIDLNEYNINSTLQHARLTNKLSFLMAECFQNIVRHGEEPMFRLIKVKKTGLFLTRHIGNNYYITSANPVANSDIDVLSHKLEEINNLGKDELKKLYIDVLNNEGFTEKGGAGLGLIEMARKSGQKIAYDFEKIDNMHSFFYMQLNMKGTTEGVEKAGNDVQFSIKNAIKLHNEIQGKNVIVLHKGDFSQNSVIPILRMIENNLHRQFEKSRMKKKAFHMLVEILQNVSKHSYKINGRHEGVFVLGRNDTDYNIATGNFIENFRIESLKNQIDKLNKLNKEELVELYKVTLKDGKGTDKGGAGLGLIDIARESTTKLNYSFIPHDDKISFYVLGSTVTVF